MGAGIRTATALFHVVLAADTREFHAAFTQAEHARKHADAEGQRLGRPLVVEEAVVDAVDPFGVRPPFIPPVEPISAAEAAKLVEAPLPPTPPDLPPGPPTGDVCEPGVPCDPSTGCC